jgi:site-specific DNA recombinase
MVHSFSKKGSRLYRYYVCSTAQKRGWQECPTKSVPAAEMERYVIDQVRRIGRDPGLVAETLKEARRRLAADRAQTEAERQFLERNLARCHAEVRRLAAEGTGETADRLADLSEGIRRSEARLAEVRAEMDALAAAQVEEREVTEALGAFDPVWDALAPREQVRLIRLLVDRVDYDGRDGDVTVTFRPAGIKALAEEVESREEVAV